MISVPVNPLDYDLEADVVKLFEDGHRRKLSDVAIQVGNSIDSADARRESDFTDVGISAPEFMKIREGKKRIVHNELVRLVKCGELDYDPASETWGLPQTEYDDSTGSGDRGFKYLCTAHVRAREVHSGISRNDIYKAIKNRPGVTLLDLEKRFRSQMPSDITELRRVAEFYVSSYKPNFDLDKGYVGVDTHWIKSEEQRLRIFILNCEIDIFLQRMPKSSKKYGETLVTSGRVTVYRVTG